MSKKISEATLDLYDRVAQELAPIKVLSAHIDALANKAGKGKVPDR